MSTDRWNRQKDLFDQASRLPAEQRSGFLDETCADDPDLRRIVEALVRLYEDSNRPAEARAWRERLPG